MTAFALGQLFATPGALRALEAVGGDARTYLAQHAAGAWGALSADDAALNDLAVVSGARILSSYRLADDVHVWTLTEATDDDGRRAATTLLLPGEY